MSVCSFAHNKDAIHKVQFDDVRITIPADPKFVPYKDYIGSNLEILDLETGRRKLFIASAIRCRRRIGLPTARR